MPISLEHRRVGDIIVVTCVGRIVEGAESIAVQKLLDDLLQYGSRLVLHLGAVDFLDSSGLGLLVRYVARTRNGHGGLKFCALSPKIIQVLDVTHGGLRCIDWRPIIALYQLTFRRRNDPAANRHPGVDGSSDVQAYVLRTAPHW
jgi:anti-anti-sigma factor